MNRAFEYAAQSLAHAGFVVMHGQIAVELRPDLWHTGIEASGDVADRRTRTRLEALPRVSKLLVRLDGFDDPVDVLARSMDSLATRIEQITGRRCKRVDEGNAEPIGAWERRCAAMDQQARTKVAAASVASAPPVRRGSADGDAWAHVATKEGPRTCGKCSRYSAAGTCMAAAESGLAEPNPRTPRRCIAFTPRFESLDGRAGRVLWPELAAAAAPAGG